MSQSVGFVRHWSRKVTSDGTSVPLVVKIEQRENCEMNLVLYRLHYLYS